MRLLRGNGELGQGLVEFAVIFPIFILLLAAVWDVGLGFNRQATIQHAAREGARFAAVGNECGAVLTRTVDQAQGLVEDADITITYEDLADPSGIDVGDAVDVTVSYEYDPFFLKSVLGLFPVSPFPDTITIEVTGSARIEALPETGPCT